MTVIQRWGNSSAVRIPKAILQATCLNDNDEIEFEVRGEVILMKKKKSRLTFDELVKGYKGDYEVKEWDTGEPVGEEIF